MHEEVSRVSMSVADLEVHSVAPNRWRVVVRGGVTTTHNVTIPEGYLDQLGVGTVAPERVVEESFRFLLERESNTSILTSFELPVIARYFPEYGRAIARRLR